ncbi:MAG: hypothetical protein AB8F95_02335 [Bacteroidia bacterium]
MRVILTSFLLMILCLPLAAQDQVSDCAAADLQLRNMFMEWKPGQLVDMKQVNMLHKACPEPGARSGMIQTYFEVYDLLVQNTDPGAEAAEKLYAAYQRLNTFAGKAREVANQDPAFAEKLLLRAQAIETVYREMVSQGG